MKWCAWPIRSVVFSVLATIAGVARAENSIRDLPQLASHLIHHFSCDVSVFNKDQDPGNKTGTFIFVPDPRSGKQIRGGIDLALGSDVLTASANPQLLQLKWTRGGKLIGSAVTMIQNSPTRAYVLIINDPANEENLAHISCSAVNYASPKGAQ